MKVKYLFLIVVPILASCVSTTKCQIEPIPLSVIDTLQLKGDFVFKSTSGILDTLVLIDHHNEFTEYTKQSLLMFDECGHSIGFNYISKNSKGTINVYLHKNETNEYTFSIKGFCISEDILLSETDVSKDSLISICMDKCELSNFKSIAFRKYKIDYFETQNGDVWRPIHFIPK